ncbi:MAG: putative penicillinase repressor [Candidatus Hydrogenedentota bacterium]
MRFTPGELQCMQVLWNHNELKPSEIQDLLPRRLQNSALRSYLAILLEKGHVTRRKVGKAYYYKAKTRRDKAFKESLRAMADAFANGSTKRLLAHFVKTEKLSAEDMEEIRRIAYGDGPDRDDEGDQR